MDIEGLILDVDGVISRGRKPIERAIEGYRLLRDAGIKTVFVSNNSARSRRMMVEKFSGYGMDVDEAEIIVATHATAVFIRERDGKSRVYTTGEHGLVEELENEGHEVVEGLDADYLVAASNRNINFEIFTKALRLALNDEVKYVAVNPDRIFPGEDGPVPGTGLVIGAVYWMTGREPDAVVGKPSRVIVEQAVQMLGVERDRIAIVGDQIEIDVLAGKNSGLKTVLVLSGVTTRDNYEKKVNEAGLTPDFVFGDLYDFAQRVISRK
ncbi:HAD-IIA family hydrolase [Geoglobus acetivorans]|uniref:HAD-IIA family hydrolase n=1 Tax=Geoglobus acetivorans TaxID=565033 RepID=A0ABZ3H4F7_GEOAI|nr:HAD-IIA family hydrolase [Geoglobus acetivorans]